MAITVIAQPDSYQPAYNPIVYKVYSDSVANISELPGFKYVFGIQFDGETNQNIFKTYPDLDRNGQLDISKIIQSKIDSYLNLEGNVEVLNNQTSQVGYTIKFGEEYPLEWNFDDYSFSYFVQLDGTNPHTYIVGDQIIIKINPSITDNRKKLNGTFNVVEVVDSNSIRINLLYTEIGDGPVTPGTTFYSDRRKESTYPNVTLTGMTAYNEAVPFAQFPTWTQAQILPTIWNTALDNGSVDGKILTNAPNAVSVQYGYDPENGYFGENKDKNRFTIKPYQKLYWNFMEAETDLVNSVIAYTNDGRRFLLPSDGSAIMKQFDVSPTAPWINITPNTGTGGTIIDYSLSNCEFYDVFPIRQQGFDDCDVITIEFSENGTIVNTYTAYASGQWNGRRKYEFTDVNNYSYEIRNVYNGPLNPNGSWTIQPLQPIPQIPTLLNNTTSGEAKGLRSDGVTLNNNVDAWLAFDGDPATYWESTGSLGQGILQYMFNDTFGIMQSYRVVSATASGAPKNWTIEVSDNGVTWIVADTVTNNTSLDVTRNAAYQAKYFRLRVTATQDGTNLKINTFQIFNTWSIANMSSASECPTNGGFLIWQNNRTRPAGITTYTYDTFESLTADHNPVLQPHRIYLDNTCQDNQTQILFLDRSGSWSSFAFPLKVNERMDNEKLNYRTNIGFVENSQWTYNTYDSEVKNYNSEVKKQYNITTNFMNKSMDDYFQELISSPVTYIKLKDSNDWLSCNILTKSLEPITRRLIQRTITIELNSQDNINI
jgi:hypothetical protein